MVGLLVVTSCGEQSRVDPEAAVTVEGAFRDVDGSPLESRPVRLGTGVTAAEAGLGVLTVGLSCLGGGCTGDSFDTTTDALGSFGFELTGRDTQSAIGEATPFVLSTSAEPPAGRPTGPAISARFRVQTTDVALPDLALVDVLPTLEATAGGQVSATWNGIAAPAPYTVSFLSRAGAPVWDVDATEPRVSIDGRVLEDVTGLATVSSSRSDAIEGSDLEIVARSSGVAFRGGFGPPPSRGASCELHGDGGSVRAVDSCPLTDANFSEAVVPGSVCPAESSGSSTTRCERTARVRVLLDGPMPSQLVAVRGCSNPCRIATVGEGAAATDVGPIDGPFGVAQLDERPVQAVDIITDDVSTLTEVSVWPAVSAEPLLAVEDATNLVPGQPGDRGGDDRLVTAAAVALLALAVLLLGVAIGRRGRSSGQIARSRPSQ